MLFDPASYAADQLPGLQDHELGRRVLPRLDFLVDPQPQSEALRAAALDGCEELRATNHPRSRREEARLALALDEAGSGTGERGIAHDGFAIGDSGARAVEGNPIYAVSLGPEVAPQQPA